MNFIIEILNIIMEATEIKNLDNLKKLTTLYFHTLKPANDKTDSNVAQIKFQNYSEMGYFISDMLKMCILTLDQNAHNFLENNKKQSINVSLILETILQLIPLDEFEFLSEINEIVMNDSNCINS
ncbi:hypothetical protein [Flavobacterium anhuiense]|uniref:hypothetical protein n=1 Tax=Flavobacterium anhuiense TaxID=459526 RepID=UPI0029393901|nr:hypothetical protein [Flavobacterium anhuiense]